VRQDPSFACSAGSVAIEHAAIFATTVVSNAQRSSSKPDRPKFSQIRQKMTGHIHSTIITKHEPAPTNNSHTDNVKTSNDQQLESSNMLSKHHHSVYPGKGNACKSYLDWDDDTCHNRSVNTAHLLPPQVSFSRLTQLDKKSLRRSAPSQTLNLNTTQCRISINGMTITEVKDLHSPSKNGTSRPLRPPCPSPGSRFEHHLITLRQQGLSP
jgi:hypothetical protein